MKKSNHGGARKGAGGPKLGKVRLTLNVRKETKRTLDREARVNKTTLGGVIDAVVAEREIVAIYRNEKIGKDLV